MKEKTKLRVIQILCIVSLLITVFSMQRTYAKYYEKLDTQYVTNIKRWAIKVTNTYIHKGTTLSQLMQPTFIANEHMNSNNTLVPGRLGYFEFDIDFTEVDVPFRYEFDIEQLNKHIVTDEVTGETTEEDYHLTDFQIYCYSIVDGANEYTTNLSEPNKLSEITQYINPNDEDDYNSNDEKKRKIRVHFRWYDGADNTMDNAADTAYKGEINTQAGADGKHKVLNYNVKISFTQTF